MTKENTANLHVKFSGEQLPRGTIDIYDLTDTILAIGQVIEGIAKEEDIRDRHNIKIEVSALRPGSFEVDLSIKIAGAIISGASLLNISPLNQAKAIIDVLASVIDVKKFLKGERPKSIKVNQAVKAASVTIININGDNTDVTIPVYNALQSKQISEGVKKMFQPLAKDGGNVDKIGLSSDDGKIATTEVSKEEFPYFDNTEELQTASNFKIKGTVSAFDRKTDVGRITLQDGKRPTFELQPPEDIQEFELMILTIIESLKLKVPIYLIGEAVLDYASNLKKIRVAKVESEAKLL